MKVRFSFIMQILSVIYLASCANAPPQREPNVYANVPLASRFYLEKFDLKLSQRYTFPKYTNEEQLEKVVRINGVRVIDFPKLEEV